MRLHMLVYLALTVSLVGCGGEKVENVEKESTFTSSQVNVSLPAEDSIEFQLDNSEPVFESVDLGDAIPVLEEPEGETQHIPDVGSNIDVDVDVDSSSNILTGINDNELDVDETSSLSPSAVEPNEENAYPNTGIFLEED